jgi:carbon monoxide dehydrogenase subunit G
MELSNEFVVPIGVDEAWTLLTDVERIAPCMPGAELQEVQGDEYRGVVKIKVGPISAQYKGKAMFVEKDEGGHRAVLRAEGRDVRGQGNANATITATLVPEGEGTKVNVVTDLTITGRAAQFGRGVLADVSTRLLGQFVSCLETKVLAGVGAATGAAEAQAGAGAPAGASDAGLASSGNGAGSSSGAAPLAAPTATGSPPPGGPRTVSYEPAEPVNLLETAGAPVLKRLIPAVVGALLAFWLQRRLLRRFRGRS